MRTYAADKQVVINTVLPVSWSKSKRMDALYNRSS